MPFNYWQQQGDFNLRYVDYYLEAARIAFEQQQAAAQVKQAPLFVEEEEDENVLNKFKVGCDPEFMLLDGAGKTQMANLYFPHDGDIGFDHNGRVAEFRPAPTRGVYPIIKKIQTLVQSPLIKQANSRLRAGAICNKDCLGGHVHFGFNCFAVKPPQGYSILNGMGGQLNEKGTQVTKALDTLTKALEHLDILPQGESTRRRGHGQGYGRYGDVRDCDGHMEYRTMASWLYDPKVAFLCLTASKLAAVDPEGTIEALAGCGSWATFKTWLEGFKGKDINATRAVEKLLDRGLKYLQVDPEVDFRERWQELGI